MIPENYQFKIGDKLIMDRDKGLKIGYGSPYVDDCCSGVVITEIRKDREPQILTYVRIDGHVSNHTNGSTPGAWHTSMDSERTSAFNFLELVQETIQEPIVSRHISYNRLKNL